MNKLATAALLASVAFVALPASSPAQDFHPKKKVFQDLKSWPATAPGDVKLKNFAPFRAVYDRVYKQGAGPNAGEAREDRIIINAEHTGWDGRRALSINIIDSGIENHSDTNARVATLFIDRQDMRALFEIGPIPGKGKDYYIGRLDPDQISLNMIDTKAQTLKPEKMKTDIPGFGPAAWVMASMKLRVGTKINLVPCYSLSGPLTSATYGHIVGKGKFKDGSGKEHSSWVLETSRNMSTPRVRHIHLTDRPPYYLGTETVDLDTGERKRFAWLRGVVMMES